MDAVDGKTSIFDWDEGDVHAFFTKLGFPQYENHIRGHNISGDVLCLLDAEGLKEVGVATIGQRLAILKAVYNIKLAQNIPIEPDHYVPPSEIEERQEHFKVDKLYDLLKEQSERLRHVEEENRNLRDSLHSFNEDVQSIRSSISSSRHNTDTESPVRSHSFKWASFVKPIRSPTKAAPEIVESPQSSPQRLEHDINTRNTAHHVPPERPRPQQPPPAIIAPELPALPPPAAAPQASTSTVPPAPKRQDSQDNLKSFKVSLDDPAWKVLPAALKKYKINNDDWQNYAMFICYGSPNNRIERCLSYDEKPLLLFQKLKDAKKNPVFMLKHIKDIRSPIAVAQQKQKARKAGSEGAKSPPIAPTALQVPAQDGTNQPKLNLNSHVGTSNGPNTGLPGGQSGWPELMSPAVDNKERNMELGAPSDEQKTSTAHNGSAPSEESAGPLVVREIPPSTGVSYAVAIYPYMAEQEDEFDVVVGDTFIILSRARGWWVVQPDPAGSGIIEPDPSKQGWVPAGCLLETNVPVANAIAEATARTAASGSQPEFPDSRTPILPLSILSTSFPGIALTDYKKKGEEELDLVKDDTLRVFKRYNHWSYAVKEETGDRGWVPSWFIGKVPQPAGNPQTPGHNGNQNLSVGEGDSRFGNEHQQPQVSPMSSAFPPMQTQPRTTVV